MRPNEKVLCKIQKTVKRINKAIEYNDMEYIEELVRDVAEFAYISGLQTGEETSDVRGQQKCSLCGTSAVCLKAASFLACDLNESNRKNKN